MSYKSLLISGSAVIISLTAGIGVWASWPKFDFYCQGVACYDPHDEHLGTVREMAERQDPEGRILDRLSSNAYVNALVSKYSHEMVYGPTFQCTTQACRDQLAFEQFMVQTGLYNQLYETLVERGPKALNSPHAIETVLNDSRATYQ